MRDMRKEDILTMRNGRADGPLAKKEKGFDIQRICGVIWQAYSGLHVYETYLLRAAAFLSSSVIPYLRRHHLCDTGYQAYLTSFSEMILGISVLSVSIVRHIVSYPVAVFATYEQLDTLYVSYSKNRSLLNQYM